MLQMKNITKVFNPGTVNEKKALSQVNFSMDEGDFVTVIGGNGAGKSTLLNCIAGVYTLNGGQILLEVERIVKGACAVDFIGRLNGTVITPQEILKKLEEAE